LFDKFGCQVALQMCDSYVGDEMCTSGVLWAPLPPSQNIVPPWNFQFR